MDKFPFFYAWHGRWTGGDWFYKIYIAPHALYGAVIGNQFPLPAETASIQIQPVEPKNWLASWNSSLFYQVDEIHRPLENFYDSLEPDNLELLTTDARNFCFVREQIKEIRFSPRFHWWTFPTLNSGTMHIHLHDQKKLWFVIQKNQNTRAIANQVQTVTPNIKIK